MPSPGSSPRPRTGRLSITLLGAAAALLVLLPWLPTGPDVYAHAAWAHQSLRCLAGGSLPLWLPDLNAGCGSPGFRLYSPAGPFLAGVFGLASGSALAGLRLLLVLAFGLLVLLMRCEDVERPPMGLVLVLAAPPVAADLFTRSAFSELAAIPAAWWLLDRAVTRGRPRPSLPAAAAALGALWLLHAPTTVLVVLLVGAAALSRGPGTAWFWIRAGLAGGLLTAWHWLPLLQEMALVGGGAGLKGGIFTARANLLGSPTAHAPGLNGALSAAAVTLLLVVVVEGWHRSDPLRAALVVLAVGLASPLSAPLWSPGSPLAWLQFPWRWLLPAALLAVRPLAERTPVTDPRSWILGALWLAPLLVLPVPPVVRAPSLGPADGWREAGARLHEAIGSNPLYVAMPQNRPPWYTAALAGLPALGGAAAAVPPEAGMVHALEQRPLDRRYRAVLSRPAPVTLRLLDYPWWEVEVDGRPARTVREVGLLRVLVPEGDHAIRVSWRGNPLARVGLALAAGGALLLWTTRRRRAGTGAGP